MINKEFLSDLRIIECLITDYGIKVTALTMLPLGADMDASVYKVQGVYQQFFFVKVKRGHHQS